MKVRVSVKPMCDKCKVIRRRGVFLPESKAQTKTEIGGAANGQNSGR